MGGEAAEDGRGTACHSCHSCHTHLRPLGLDAAETVGPVDDGVFGDHLIGVNVAAGTDDAAARQDDVPADKCCEGEDLKCGGDERLAGPSVSHRHSAQMYL